MRKIVSLSFILIFTILSFNSCTKFAEDDGISLKSKKARLTTKWTVKEIYNSENKEITVKEFITLMAEEDIDYYGVTPSLKFLFESDYTMEFIIGVSLFTIKSKGTWEFFGDTGVEIDLDENTTYGVPAINEEYNIIKLSSSELWMEYSKADDVYEIHLES